MRGNVYVHYAMHTLYEIIAYFTYCLHLLEISFYFDALTSENIYFVLFIFLVIEICGIYFNFV